MKAMAFLMLLVAPIVGIVALVFRVDVATWNLATTLVAGAVTFSAAVLATGAASNLYLRGRAALEEARARAVAADARRIHGTPEAPTFNTTIGTIGTVNMLTMRNPETGEVRQLPAGDAVTTGSLMRQYARQGYVIDTTAAVAPR